MFNALLMLRAEKSLFPYNHTIISSIQDRLTIYYAIKSINDK
jgi:hypothetical protein